MSSSTGLGSHELVAFVAASDPAPAKAFYRDTLGLQLVSDELPFALVFDAHGTMLRVTIVEEPTPAKYTVLGWRVPDIVATVSGLQQAGVELEHFARLDGQDKQGIWTSPNGTKVAWFKDPDGNVLSVTQF